MTISKVLLDELLKDCERPEDLLGDAGPNQANRRSGTSARRLKSQDGKRPIAVPGHSSRQIALQLTDRQ